MDCALCIMDCALCIDYSLSSLLFPLSSFELCIEKDFLLFTIHFSLSKSLPQSGSRCGFAMSG